MVNLDKHKKTAYENMASYVDGWENWPIVSCCVLCSDVCPNISIISEDINTMVTRHVLLDVPTSHMSDSVLIDNIISNKTKLAFILILTTHHHKRSDPPPQKKWSADLIFFIRKSFLSSYSFPFLPHKIYCSVLIFVYRLI